MKKGEVYEGVVVKYDFPNKAQVEVIEKNESGEEVINRCMVKNVLPGQKVLFRVIKKRHGDCEGMLLKVLEKGQDESDTSNCPHFGICGGCSYQSYSAEKQLEVKEQQVLELLKPVLGDIKNTEIYKGAKASPLPFEYKNKMEFSFGDMEKGGELMLGLHRRGSFYDVVPVPECKIVNEDVRKIMNAVLKECREQKLSYFHKMSHEGLLRHLVIRRAEKTGEILVNLVTTSQVEFDIEAIKQALLGLELKGKICGFIHCINDSVADTVQADELRVIWGRSWFYEELLGLTFKVSPFSFFQTNSLGAEVLYDTARGFILEAMREQGLISDSATAEEIETSGPVIYDLYSGTGTIAQLLAPVAKKVIGVEIVEEAVKAAEENTVGNNLHNCEFIAGDVLKTLDDIETKPDFIVLDPPRDGINPKALPKLVAYGVQNMIYISCKPTSLARDLPFFMEAGYEAVKVAMVDMFPFTANIETICLLRMKPWGRG